MNLKKEPGVEWDHLIFVKPGALGDTLLLAPVLRAIRSLAPGLQVTVVGTCPAVDLLRVFGVADKTVSFERLHLFMAPRTNEPRFQGAAVMAFIRRDTEAVDPFVRRGAKQVVWNPSRPGDDGPHVVHYLHGCLGQLIPELPEPTREPFPASKLIHPPSMSPYIVLAPGAGSERKQFPLERFAAIAEDAAAQGITPLFIAGEVELEKGQTKLYPDAYPLLISPPLTDLAGLLAGAVRFYGNDSGPGHLAGLVGADATVFFGPTNPDVWKPWGERVTVKRF